MTQHHKHPHAPAKDKPVGDSKAGGEAPTRRFADRPFAPGYAQKGDVERPPFEGHPDHDANRARPRHRSPGPETSGQHGQRPKHDPSAT